jgi:hypothetical protein
MEKYLEKLRFEAGGNSVIKKLTPFFGWWQVVGKNFMVNKYIELYKIMLHNGF